MDIKIAQIRASDNRQKSYKYKKTALQLQRCSK